MKMTPPVTSNEGRGKKRLGEQREGGREVEAYKSRGSVGAREGGGAWTGGMDV